VTTSDTPTPAPYTGGSALVDDGLWELALGGLLLALALTLETGSMPVLAILAIPVAVAAVRWTVVRPRLEPGALRRQLGALNLGPLGVLCVLVAVGAVVIGAMARDGREAFEPARSAAPGMAAAAILALAVIAALLGTRLKARRFIVWAGLALVGLLLDPIAAPSVRAWALVLLSVAVIVSGLAGLWRFVKSHPARS
jgi:hypothetical protein